MLDIIIALIAIIPIMFYLWISRIHSGDAIGNMTVGLVMGLAIYCLIRLYSKR
jgi:hypothetical protein